MIDPSPDICLVCDAKSSVIDTRYKDGQTYRRRVCDCGERWTTYEMRRDDIQEAYSKSKTLDRVVKAISDHTS